jgi:hypothetical protein
LHKELRVFLWDKGLEKHCQDMFCSLRDGNLFYVNCGYVADLLQCAPEV